MIYELLLMASTVLDGDHKPAANQIHLHTSKYYYNLQDCKKQGIIKMDIMNSQVDTELGRIRYECNSKGIRQPGE